MKTYHVIWEIHIEAESPEDAALCALGMQRDSESTATVFSISDENDVVTVIDVENEIPVIIRDERT